VNDLLLMQHLFQSPRAFYLFYFPVSSRLWRDRGPNCLDVTIASPSSRRSTWCHLFAIESKGLAAKLQSPAPDRPD